jgi:hypothetical protein
MLSLNHTFEELDESFVSELTRFENSIRVHRPVLDLGKVASVNNRHLQRASYSPRRSYTR